MLSADTNWAENKRTWVHNRLQ